MSEANQSKLNRRSLLLAATTGAVLAPAVVQLLSSQAFAAGEVVDESKMVKSSDPVATALKYVDDHTKAKDQKEKQGVKPADQKCSGCMLYAAQGKLKNGKEVGKCTMITAGLVYGNGYCNSWTKKT